MNQVYIVLGNDGAVTDNFEWIDGIFASYERARKHVESKGFKESEKDINLFYPASGDFSLDGTAMYAIELWDVQ